MGSGGGGHEVGLEVGAGWAGSCWHNWCEGPHGVRQWGWKRKWRRQSLPLGSLYSSWSGKANRKSDTQSLMFQSQSEPYKLANPTKSHPGLDT